MGPHSVVPFLLLVIVSPVIFAAGIAGTVIFYFGSYRAILNDWARRHNLVVVSARPRHLFTGPFFPTSASQLVYRVTVRDVRGHNYNGWVRCGGFWLGCFSSQADVVWDNVRLPISGKRAIPPTAGKNAAKMIH